MKRYLALLILASVLPCRAAAPEWLRAAARVSLPAYPPETKAVVLFDERVVQVKDNGEVKTVYRRAYRILRPEGKSYGSVVVPFDNETKLTFLKGWGITSQGAETELKEKDAVETSSFSDELYSDKKAKVLLLPQATPGNTVGYEYEQKERPFVFQEIWAVQRQVPVRLARLTLQLPPGWEYKAVWLNSPDRKPSAQGESQWVWELQDIAPLEPEDFMPDWRVVTTRLALTYFPRQGGAFKSLSSWRDVGTWYTGLTAGSVQATPEIHQKAVALAGTESDPIRQIRLLAEFVQRQIRYVAIEIGIGGYQPHPASAVLASLSGDCKDKVTLLKALLHEAGVESYYVLVNTDRGVVLPDFPSMVNFNHVILAVPVPKTDQMPMFSVLEHPRLGRLLFFDPTSTLISFGDLPTELQASNGLVMAGDGGELVKLPLTSGGANRLLRTGNFKLGSDGTLSGSVQETRFGEWAAESRAVFQGREGAERAKALESFLGRFLSGFELEAASIENLQALDQHLALRYRFRAPGYAKTAGNLLMLRPRVLGAKASSLSDKKERKYPVEFPMAAVEIDAYEIELPAEYDVDELPDAVTADFGFARYESKTEVKGHMLHYQRSFTTREVAVPAERLADVRKLFGQINADERNSAVLKRNAQ